MVHLYTYTFECVVVVVPVLDGDDTMNDVCKECKKEEVREYGLCYDCINSSEVGE